MHAIRLHGVYEISAPVHRQSPDRQSPSETKQNEIKFSSRHFYNREFFLFLLNCTLSGFLIIIKLSKRRELFRPRETTVAPGQRGLTIISCSLRNTANRSHFEQVFETVHQ